MHEFAGVGDQITVSVVWLMRKLFGIRSERSPARIMRISPFQLSVFKVGRLISSRKLLLRVLGVTWHVGLYERDQEEDCLNADAPHARDREEKKSRTKLRSV